MSESLPPVQYAKGGAVDIAYRVLGDGPPDLVWVPGLFSNLETDWEDPFLQRGLASFSRLIAFDKRGMGLSGRNVGSPTLEERMDDVGAVMDAVGSERATLLGVSEGGPMSVLFAATHPERTAGLILYGTSACFHRDGDYTEGIEDTIAELYRIMDDGWGTGASMQLIARSLMGDEQARAYFGRMERTAGSPQTVRTLLDTLVGTDIRAVLPSITVPTLVIHARDDHTVPIANGRWLADHIDGAKFVEIGGEHGAFDFEQFTVEIETFLTGRRQTAVTDRVLATLLFSDVVESTERAAAVGDRRWRELLDQHDAVVHREVENYRGTLVNISGDGVLATFDGPARAVTCGRAIRDGLRRVGLDVRVGVHTGEIEVRGDDVGGIAVHIGARVAATAGTGEILVSRTVTDLVVGSGITFEDRGDHELKGVPGTWPLFAVCT